MPPKPTERLLAVFISCLESETKPASALNAIKLSKLLNILK